MPLTIDQIKKKVLSNFSWKMGALLTVNIATGAGVTAASGG
jgi:hypothetical protein